MKLIYKDAVVAEIERRKSQFMSQADSFNKLGMEEKRGHYAILASNMHSLLSFIDTLEVKEVDLEKDVRQIIDLYLEAGKHYDDVIKKERDMYGYSDLAIKLLDRTADAKEMSIQYVLDKLKTQKGE